jgi:CRISPR-associated protein Cas2
MIVMILENVPASLRGELSRWLLEVQVNVFVGSVSSLVRDKLWELACSKLRVGNCTIIYRANTEQGFHFRTFGPTKRTVEDFDGLQLARIPGVGKGRG